MGQGCGKIPDSKDTSHIRSSNGFGTKLQGDIGEQVAAQVATNQLNLNAEYFDPPHNGFDGVYRDSYSKLVIIEAKLTTGGMSSLGQTSHGRQGSVEWIQNNAEKMCDPLSPQWSQDNAKIGEEILRVGAENVHMIVIHTNPGTLETSVHNIR